MSSGWRSEDEQTHSYIDVDSWTLTKLVDISTPTTHATTSPGIQIVSEPQPGFLFVDSVKVSNRVRLFSRRALEALPPTGFH